MPMDAAGQTAGPVPLRATSPSPHRAKRRICAARARRTQAADIASAASDRRPYDPIDQGLAR